MKQVYHGLRKDEDSEKYLNFQSFTALMRYMGTVFE